MYKRFLPCSSSGGITALTSEGTIYVNFRSYALKSSKIIRNTNIRISRLLDQEDRSYLRTRQRKLLKSKGLMDLPYSIQEISSSLLAQAFNHWPVRGNNQQLAVVGGDNWHHWE